MKKSSVSVTNSIQFEHQSVPFGTFAQLLLDGKVVSVKEFLQRPLLKEEWESSKYKPARDYIASVWKGTFGLDGFSMVPINLVIQKLEEEYTSTDNKAYQDALSLLTTLRDQGVLFLTLDGQSRGFLAILPYVKGDIEGLAESADDIMLTIDGKLNKQILKSTKYLDLPSNVREVIDSRMLSVTIVKDFYEFKDVIDTLVNKQKGWSWAKFQVVKQQNRFGKFVVGLIDLFNTKNGIKFSTLWKEKMNKVKNDFKFNRDGHQNFAIILSTLLTDGQWIDKVSSKLKGVDGPSQTHFDKVFTYSNELLSLRKDATYISELINWNVFRWVIEGGSRSNDLYKKLQHTKRYSIVDLPKLMNVFIKHHIEIKGSKKNPHTLSWMSDSQGNIVRIDQGYSHANENQSTQSITSRMTMFLSSFPWDQCVNEGILRESDSMPLMSDVVIHNDFKDLNGKPLNMLDLSSYDRSHKESKKNGGSNLLENLVVEEAGENRSRGGENI